MPNTRERILVADDHRENIRFIVDAVLAPNGFQALTASDGAEALQKALKENPDLLLLDLQMPKMSGLEVLKALRDRGIRVPVVLMTFHGSEEIAVEGFRLGARDYVIKPFTAQDMLTAIEGALIESRLRAERDALTERLMKANQQLERRLREMRTIYAIGQSVTSVLDLDELLGRVIDAALYLSAAQLVSIMLLDGPSSSLRVAAERHRENMRRTHTGDLSRTTQALEAIRGGKITTAVGDHRSGTRVFVPLETRGRPIGVLVAQWPAGSQAPHDHYIQLLTLLAGYAAIAIENARGFERLEVTKEQEKDQIRECFGRYVAPTVVERILSDPQAVRLGGAKQEISVIFADLQGFSSLSERIPPEDLVDILSRYLSIMAETIISAEGTIDKFLGDGLMAIFNAPLSQPDHVFRAACAALNLKEAVAQFHRQLPPDLQLQIRIGVNTGEAVVGNIGARNALSYTAIGDGVNLTRRLQEVAEPGQILISENSLHHVYDRVEVTSLGLKRVKGRQREERVFELLRVRE